MTSAASSAHPQPSSLEAALIEALAARVAKSPRVGVALSGGQDSIVLLHALSRLRADGRLPARLSALHVHHGLSARADAWADFCADQCAALDIPLQIERVNVPRDSGEGLEGAARRLRHAAFARFPVDWLVLAHHRDDQAETVLLHLLRGSGVAGASGMPAERALIDGPVLIRPWLAVARPTLEAYADAHQLRWIEDESNADRHFRRNYLRHEVLPGLDTQFPGARQSLVRAAAHFAEAAGLLDDLALHDAARVRQPSGRLGLLAFNQLAPAHARNLLRQAWIAAGFRAPSARWIEEARKQLAVTGAESETCVTTPEGALQVYRGELYFVPQRRPAPFDGHRWQGESAVPWAGGSVRFEAAVAGGIRPELLANGGFELRARQGGERFRTQSNRPRRALRNVLQSAAIPPWERERLPLGWSGDRLVWVGGFGVDADCACASGETGLMPVWHPDD